MKKKILLIGAVFASMFTYAQEEPAADTGLKISGYVDTYYKTNLNGGQGIANDGLSPYANSFELGNVNLKLAQDFGKVGFVAQLAFGSRAEAANFDSTPNSGLLIQQAYLYYKPADMVTLTAGNFSTFVGYEVIDSPANFHYSVSNLFQNGPYYHTGLKADFDLGGGLGFMAGIFDEMDRKSNAQSGINSLNYGAQLKYGADNMNFYLNYLGGKEAGVNRNQIDLVADYKMDKIYLAINPTYVTFNPDGADAVSWYGAALYTQYQLNDMFSVGLRSEYLNNEDGVLSTAIYPTVATATTYGKSMWDFTLSTPLTLAKGLKVIPEIRMDISEDDIFLNSDGELKSNQVTLGIAAMYSF